jgi:adenylate cyclase
LITVRGHGELIAVFDPWPTDASSAWRTAYLAAYRLLDRDPVQAATQFDTLAMDRPMDPVPRLIAERMLPCARARSHQGDRQPAGGSDTE